MKNRHVRLYENRHVRLYENRHVRLYENRHVRLYENPYSVGRVVPCGRKDGRTDMTKLIVAFRNFPNASTCIYVFCVDLRTNSDYFPIQH